MDAFIRVLRKEKVFIIVYGICELIRLSTGSTLPLNAFMSFLGCFTIVTIAHDEYNSVREKITCVFLAMFPLLVTCFAGIDIALVLSRIITVVLIGFFLRGARFLMRKMYS